MDNDYYHITISLKSKDRQGNCVNVSEIDLKLSVLKSSYIEPYRTGNKFIYKGKFYATTDIDSIIIRKSDKDFKTLCKELKNSSNCNGLNQEKCISNDQFVLCKLDDVTRTFIAGEPGYANNLKLTKDDIIQKLNELNITWNKYEVDLLELLVALDELGAIHIEGKKADRNELYEIFGHLFNTELKNPESQISHAKRRKKEEKHFLENLNQAWEIAKSKKQTK